MVKNSPANARDTRDMGSIPGSDRFLGGENGNLLQYSCLENPMDREAWWATVHGVTKSWTGVMFLLDYREELILHAVSEVKRKCLELGIFTGFQIF